MDYNVKTKVNGKFHTVGNVRENKYGNVQLGLRKTPELMQLLEGAPDGGWVNLSMFENDGQQPSRYTDSEESPF